MTVLAFAAMWRPVTRTKRLVETVLRASPSFLPLAPYIRIRMYGANGKKLGEARKTVSTNRFVRVTGLHIAAKAKTVKATVAS